MTDGRDPQAVLAKAQEAAGAGDYASAEQLLRHALTLQEDRLGPSHPDLAHTYNNLAVVCERLDKVAEAEQGYRRAHAIAVSSLPPRHPFVATSLRNLVDFCVAFDVPLYRPPADRAEAADAEDAPVQPPATAPAQEAPARTPARHQALAAAAIVMIAFAALLAVAPWQTGSDPPAEMAVEDRPTAPPAAAPEPPFQDDIAGVVPSPTAPASPPAAARGATESGAPADSQPDAASAPPATPGGIAVVTAQVCSAFDRRGAPDWQCTPVSGSASPGTLTYYTRIRSSADIRVEHRWYREGRPHHTMQLRVGANPGAGFRTYSRSTVGPDRAGAWSVELRGADGTVLHEEHFVVR